MGGNQRDWRERRKHERAPLAFLVRLRIGDIDRFTEHHTKDLSAGGIFVNMNYPPPVATEVELVFNLLPVKKTIHAKGVVVRSVQGKGSDFSAAGMAIRFTDLGKDGKRFFELVLRKFNRRHPSQLLEVPEDFLEKLEGES